MPFVEQLTYFKVPDISKAESLSMIFRTDVLFKKNLQEELTYSDGNMAVSVQLKRHTHPPPYYYYNVMEKLPDITEDHAI